MRWRMVMAVLALAPVGTTVAAQEQEQQQEAVDVEPLPAPPAAPTVSFAVPAYSPPLPSPPPILFREFLDAEDANQIRLFPNPKGPGWAYPGETFTAFVTPDGVVTFEDEPFTVKPLWLPFLPVPTPLPVPSIEEVVRERLDADPAVRQWPIVPGHDDVEVMLPAWPTYAEARDICGYPGECFLELTPLLMAVRARFDLTDLLMYAAGQDPYRNQKAAFLAATAAFRQQMAAQENAVIEARALAELDDRLLAIWENPGLTQAQKRAVIGQLRDELDLEREVGRRAGLIIDDFVASHVDPARAPATRTARRQDDAR